MVFTLNFSHLYHFPIDLVIKTYLEKHKHVIEKDTKVDILASYQEGEMNCIKRQLTFQNYFPHFFRKIDSLRRDEVTVEEEIWSEPSENRHWIRSHDKTWGEEVTIAKLAYVSKFEENPNWTLWEEDTAVNLGGFGFFGVVLEIYLKRLISNSTKNDFKLMERLMKSSQ